VDTSLYRYSEATDCVSQSVVAYLVNFFMPLPLVRPKIRLLIDYSAIVANLPRSSQEISVRQPNGDAAFLCSSKEAEELARRGFVQGRLSKKQQFMGLMLTTSLHRARIVVRRMQRAAMQISADDNTTVRQVRTQHGRYYEPNGRHNAYERPFVQQRSQRTA
jgi:hypothetical protein